MNKPQAWRIAHAASLTFLLAAIASTVGNSAFAQEAQPPASQLDAGGASVGDPPGRVARLNYFDGTVTFEPAGGTDWAYAELNRPMTTGDQVWVDNGGRSELHIGSTALRLGSQTALSIVNLDDQNAQLKVAQGSLETRVRVLPAGQTLEIDTPNLALQANGPGIYRVDAAPDGSSTTVTVRDGSVSVYGDTGSVQLGAGQQITFSGTNLQQTGGGSAQALDPFDEWAYSRDRAEDNSESARYVSRDVPGYQDLDANGSWEDSPDYGEVWVPRVAAGWAPYHQGHWAWVAPWGWTWVDDAPWGFAPFHYGRWAYWHNRWAWAPGPVVATAPPCYSPALVAFVGGGNGGWNVSIGVGAVATAGVAWLALGPGEPWHPAYHYTPGYFDRVNYGGRTTIVNNTTIINNHVTYVNRNVPGAVMGMPANQFVHGQDTRRYGQPMQAAQIQRATFGAGAPGIAPVRQSFGGALRPANYRPPAAVGQRQVIATRTPPTPYAYRDTLAQNFAHRGGTVPGAGQPVVRTAPPASFMRGQTPAIAARPGAPAPQQGRAGGQPGFRVVQAEHRAPVAEPGQPGQAGRPIAQGGESRAQAGQPNQPNAANAMRAQTEAGRPEQAPNNGVPRPPSMMQQPGRAGFAAGGGQPNAQQEEAQRRQQQSQQQATQMQQQRAQMESQQRGAQGAQTEQQRAQQLQGQQEQQRAQQMQEQQRQQQEQQRSQQAQGQQEQQRAQQAQEQQRQQQEQQQQRAQQLQAQQEQQRAQQAQEQQRQQQEQQQQRAQQLQAQQEQQRAQQMQQQQRQQQEQQRSQQMQEQQRQQQERAQQAQAEQRQQQEQQRAQQAQAQQERAQQAQAQRQQQMQQMQQRQQQQREQPRPQQQQQGRHDQQSSNGRSGNAYRG